MQADQEVIDFLATLGVPVDQEVQQWVGELTSKEGDGPKQQQQQQQQRPPGYQLEQETDQQQKEAGSDYEDEAQFSKLFSYNPDTAKALPPELLMPDDGTSPGPFQHEISTILVKQREGPEKEELTLPWIMKHLKPGGINQLLGAPIGTSAFCIQPGGHMDRITAQASNFISAISTVSHTQAQYHLLRWCASNSLHHCP